ncbi:hypothetical protein P5G61_03710 [Paenibacillus sp. F6_3S_P_1C]|uniref:Uncharacterized protein n=1 Tax=Paenibacillus vandeheii TaxID=3035917 RepID=A0ABT8J5I8_9BACL|nr:hypothetical protein [Paenibacillus vandeheii]MDN4600323.1 hypothetical protein [Paenibacillus vandeheii]
MPPASQSGMFNVDAREMSQVSTQDGAEPRGLNLLKLKTSLGSIG